MITLTNTTSGLVGLRKGQLLALHGRRGDRIESRRGALWVTEDGEPDDIVLDGGQAHVLDHDTRVLIQALDAACVSLQARSGPPLPAPWSQLRRRLRGAAGLRPAARAAA